MEPRPDGQPVHGPICGADDTASGDRAGGLLDGYRAQARRTEDAFRNPPPAARPKERTGGMDIFVGGGWDDRKLPFLDPGVGIAKGPMRDYADTYGQQTGRPTRYVPNAREKEILAAIREGNRSDGPVRRAAMGEFEAFKDWLGPPLNLLFVPEWYWNWARILLAAGLPAALLAWPVYLTGRVHGRRRALRAALLPVAVLLLLTVLAVVSQPHSRDLGAWWVFVLGLAWGAVIWVWAPVAGIAVWLSGRRRR